MPLNKELIEEFIQENESQYIGKYRYHSGYRIDDKTFKSHYYMLDENFRQIDIYVEVQCGEHITYTFSENLHDQEKKYIVKDALKRVLSKSKYPRNLHYSLYDNYIKTVPHEYQGLQPIDFYEILNFMKYHQGISQETIDNFYELFIPGLEMQLHHKNYEKFLNCVKLILESVLYEYEWDGINSKYLDTEYQFHLYYIRKIIRIVYEQLDKFYHAVPDLLFECVYLLCLNPRFTFAIMTDFGSMVLSQYKVTKSMIETLKETLVLNDKDENRKDANLVFSYIYYIFHNDYEQYYAVVLNVLREMIDYILTFANHDLDLALGESIIKIDGYQVILDLFHQDYNTFVFACFPIETFPKEMRPRVREELVAAIRFFAARMENDNYRLSSFEQVKNINRILMDNFKEWYK